MPNNWKTYKLEKVATLQRGFDLPNTKRSNGKYPVIAASGFSTWHNEYKVKGPGVVTGRSGTLGQVNFVKDDFWPLNTSLWVKDFHGNDERFIYYFLKTLNFEEYNSGTSVPTLNRNDVHKLDVTIPDLTEQKSIASILSAIDDKIENNLAINKTLEEMAMALYKHWFIDFGPFQDGKFIESELGMIPDGWQVKRLDELGKISYGTMPKKEKLDVSGYPVFSGYNYVGYYPEYNCLENKVIVVARGVGGTGDIKLTKEKCFLTNLSICVHNNFNLIDDILLFYSLNLKGLHFLRTGSAQPQITINDLNKVVVLIPKKNVENHFLSFFKDLTNTKEINLKENQTLTQLRDTLLPRLISGEIRLKEFQQVENIL